MKVMKCPIAAGALLSLTLTLFGGGPLFEQTGTVQKTDVSDTDLYEPTQWNRNAVPGDTDSIQLSGYSSDKRFHLTDNHANVFDVLYFKTGHNVAATAQEGSNLRFDTRTFALLLPSSTAAHASQLLWQTYIPEGRAAAAVAGTYDILSLARKDQNASTVAVVNMSGLSFHQQSGADYVTTLTFERGIFNAFDPERTGESEPDSANVYSLRFCNTKGLPTRFLFAPGTVFKVPRAEVMNDGDSTIAFNGSEFHADGYIACRGTILATNGAQVTCGYLGGNGGGNVTVKAGSLFLADSTTKLRLKGALAMDGGVLTNDSAVVEVKGDLSLNYGTPEFVQNGGSLQVTGSYGTQVADAVFRLRGGTASFANGYGLYPHGGSIYVDGGTLTANRVRWGSCASSKESKIVQTGGTIILATSDSGRPGVWVCDEENQPCRLELLGGELRAPTINGKKTIVRGGAKKGSFLGNGGRFVMTAPSPRPQDTNDGAPGFGWLDEAKIGARGFTLDSQAFAVNVIQDFANADDEDGVLVKEGSGTLSYAGECRVSKAVVAGGTLKLATAAAKIDSTLVLGPGTTFSLVGEATSVGLVSLAATNAVLALDPGDQIAIERALALENLTVRWSSEPTDYCSFLSVSGPVSKETEWAIRQIGMADASAGKHIEFEFSYDADSGMTSVRAKVAADAPLSETSVWIGSGAWATADNWQGSVRPTESRTAQFGADGAGTSVELGADDVAGALAFSGPNYRLFGSSPLHLFGAAGAVSIQVTEGDHVLDCGLDLVAETAVGIESGSSLTVNGPVRGGGIGKTGSGRLALGGALATQKGVSSPAGLLSATATGALGTTVRDTVSLGGGTLEVAERNGAAMSVPGAVRAGAADAQKAVVYKTDTDVAFDDFDTMRGMTIKRGKGTMTVNIPAETTITLAREESTPIGGMNVTTAEEGIRFPTDGSEPTGMRGPLSVVEGELRLVGLGEKARANVLSTVYVTVPTADAIAAQPVLTLDNVYFNGKTVHNGCCLGRAPFVTQTSTIRVLNGSTLYWESSMPGYACGVAGYCAYYAVTNATLWYNANGSYLTRGFIDGTGTQPIVHYLLDGSSFYIGTSAVLNGSLHMDLDNGSYFGRKSDSTPTTVLTCDTAKRVYGEIFVHGGSKLAVRDITDTTGQTRDLTLAFDGGEWQWADDHGNRTLEASVSGHIKYVMRGQGIVLRPAEGKTLTVLAPFEGEGGIVVDGPGTVALGAGSFAFSGTADVRSGTLDLASSGELVGKSFGGNGTVANGNLKACRIAARLSDGWENTNGIPVLADCMLSGRVVVETGRSAENPLALPDVRNPTAVARVSGSTSVDLNRWKLDQTGVDKVRGAFTQVGDVIYMTPSEPLGMTVIIR